MGQTIRTTQSSTFYTPQNTTRTSKTSKSLARHKGNYWMQDHIVENGHSSKIKNKERLFTDIEKLRLNSRSDGFSQKKVKNSSKTNSNIRKSVNDVFLKKLDANVLGKN